MFVSGVVADPAAQGVTGLPLHAAVGEADGERHQSQQVVGVELQTPATGETGETGTGQTVSDLQWEQCSLTSAGTRWRPARSHSRPELSPEPARPESTAQVSVSLPPAAGVRI